MRTINALTKNTKYNLFKTRLIYLSIILFYDFVMIYFIIIWFFLDSLIKMQGLEKQ